MALVASRFDAATGIGRLTLDRPEVLNAIDVPMARAFLEAALALDLPPLTGPVRMLHRHAQSA